MEAGGEVVEAGGEDAGEPKVAWSNGEVTVAVTRSEVSGPNPLFFKISGGGIVRVA
jgi:hypothetical protein